MMHFLLRRYHFILFGAALATLLWSAVSVVDRLRNLDVPEYTMNAPRLIESDVSTLIVGNDSPWRFASAGSRVFTSEPRVLCPCGNHRLLPADFAERGIRCPVCGLDCLQTPPDLDRDLDRVPDEVEARLGTDPRDPSDAETDSDGDGFGNLSELDAETDPASATSHPSYLPDLMAGPVRTRTLRIKPVGLHQIGPNEWLVQLGGNHGRTRHLRDGAPYGPLVFDGPENGVPRFRDPVTGREFVAPIGRVTRIARRTCDVTCVRLPDFRVELDDWKLEPFVIGGERFEPSAIGANGVALANGETIPSRQDP